MIVIAQIMSALAIIVIIVGYQIKNKNTIVLMIAISNFFVALSYIFLDATVGLVMSSIATIRCLASWWLGKKNLIGKNWQTILCLCFFELAFIIGTVFIWQGWLSLVCAFGFMAFTYGCFQQNKVVLIITQFAISTTNIIYNIYYLGYLNIALEALVLCAIIIPLVKEIKFKKMVKRQVISQKATENVIMSKDFI